MQFLSEIFSTETEQNIDSSLFKIRKKAIGIMLDGTKICTLRNKDNQISLPGGGIDYLETPESAVKREILEETGYLSEIKQEIGITIEYFYEFNILQFTYSYILKPDLANQQKINLTQSEIDSGIEIEWIELDEISSRITKNSLKHAGDIIMQKRALLLIEKLKEEINS